MSRHNEIKMANKIRDALIKLKTQKDGHLIDNLKSCQLNLKNFTSNLSKLEKAYRNDYRLAVQRLKTKIGRDVNELYHSVNRARQFFEISEDKIPDFKPVFEEVAQLIDEPDNSITIDYEKNTLSMETEPIELEGLYLGRFCISLCISDIPKLCSLSPYNIIALEPNPAATNEDITHPHVSCEKLCEGDGTTAIAKALTQARLTDFFTIVKNILKTYNPDSPYVAIDEWDGTACYDCGYICDSDHRYYCELCSNDYCEECASYCRVCDETTCNSCGSDCPECEEFVCKSCLAECSNCGKQMCKNCIEENDLCFECKIELEEMENNENEENNHKTEQSDTTKTSPEIQPDSMGQTSLHA